MSQKSNAAKSIDSDKSMRDQPAAKGEGTGTSRVVVEESYSNLVEIHLDAVPPDVALPCSLYIKVAAKYPLYKQQGEKVSKKRLLELGEKGVSTLYIHKVVWRVFMHELEKQQVMAPPNSPQAAGVIRNLIEGYSIALDKKIQKPKKGVFEKLENLSGLLATIIRKDVHVGLQLLRKNPQSTLYYTSHALNVSIYSSVIGLKLNLPEKDAAELAYAGLVHDIGYLALSKQIVFKTSAVTVDEIQALQSHCRKGAEMLQTMGAPQGVIQTALQHHERMDGQGYPDKLSGEAINHLCRIVSVANVYDSLTNPKSYGTGLSPKEAIEKMKGMTGQFDPQILAVVK